MVPGLSLNQSTQASKQSWYHVGPNKCAKSGYLCRGEKKNLTKKNHLRCPYLKSRIIFPAPARPLKTWIASCKLAKSRSQKLSLCLSFSLSVSLKRPRDNNPLSTNACTFPPWTNYDVAEKELIDIPR